MVLNSMDGQTGLIIFYIIFGFFSFCVITFGIVVLILWNRRKLIFCNFLSTTGQWEREAYKPKQIQSNAKTKRQSVEYDGQTYFFDLKLCTRDRINRPIAHYYKGNPEQQTFDYDKSNQQINIGTEDVSNDDFQALIKSKVIRDIFLDEEVMNMLWIILIVMIVIGVAILIVNFAYNPPVELKATNETMKVITDACRVAIRGK